MTQIQDLIDDGAMRVVSGDRRQILTGGRRFILYFWLSMTLFYMAFSPSTISFMGYMEENLTAAEQVTDNLLRLGRGEAPAKVSWTHHGCTEVFLEAPFLLFSRFVFGASRAWNGRVIVLQSILATSLLCALLLAWTQRLTGSWVWAYWLALSAGIATMLLPYAYIWMETTQSIFLLLAGYLALGREPKRTWGELLLFTVACAIAVSAKQTGVFLSPALFFLVWAYCRDKERAGLAGLPGRWKEAAIVIVAMIAAVALN